MFIKIHINSKLPITKIILITFVSIMLVSNLISGTIIFRNWLAYADIGLIEIIDTLDKNVFNKIELFMENNFVDMEENNKFNNYLEEIVGDNNSIIVIIDRQTGELVERNMHDKIHHSKRDGTGYPKGLKGEEIPIIARIIAVVKGYDAMINRVDSSGISYEEAIKEIKSQSGIKYDPIVVENFLGIR